MTNDNYNPVAIAAKLADESITVAEAARMIIEQKGTQSVDAIMMQIDGITGVYESRVGYEEIVPHPINARMKIAAHKLLIETLGGKCIDTGLG